MNIHKNARLTPIRREEMALCVLEGRLSKAAAARVYAVTAKIVARWAERYKARGRFAPRLYGYLSRRKGRERRSLSQRRDRLLQTPRRHRYARYDG